MILGEWYHVKLGRRMKEGHLIINNGTKVTGKSPGRTRGLNIRSPIFFGGIDRDRYLIGGPGPHKGFKGCISNLKLGDYQAKKVKFNRDVLQASNVKDCSESNNCVGLPCQNGGKCQLSSSLHRGYVCQCQDGFR